MTRNGMFASVTVLGVAVTALAIGGVALTGLVLGGCSMAGCGMHDHSGGPASAGGQASAGAQGDASAKIVNAKCPIMGGTPVPSLTREYKDQTVAFCCGGCPGTWDKLSDADKDAKLAKVMPAKQ